MVSCETKQQRQQQNTRQKTMTIRTVNCCYVGTEWFQCRGFFLNAGIQFTLKFDNSKTYTQLSPNIG